MVEAILSTDNGLVIDYCPVNRIPEIQGFINDHWRQGHILSRDSELLRWQYAFPGDMTKLSILTSREGDALTGILGLIPFRFCQRGKSLPACWLALWMAPQGKGNKLTGLRLFQRALAQDRSFVGSLGVNEDTYPVYEALGFDIRKSIPRWVLPGSSEHAKSLFGDQAIVDGSATWRKHQPESDQSPIRSTINLIEWNAESVERWDSAWNEYFAPRLMGPWRDSGYLRWRYIDHPRFKYVVRFAKDSVSGAVSGLLVYRVETVRDHEAKVLRILEFLGSGPTGTELARAVVQAAESEGVAFSDFYCTSTSFAAPLEEAGFVLEEELGVSIPSRFQPLDWQSTSLNGTFWASPEVAEDSRSFFQTSDFYVTRADCDQDRPN